MRNISKWLAVGALLATGSTALIAIADDAPATPPAEHAPTTRPMRMAHVVKPWSDLSDLTDDQKNQIIAIHQKADADRLAISRKEHEDIMTLLSDDQKKELAESEAKARADAAARHKQRNAEPTTKPAE